MVNKQGQTRLAQYYEVRSCGTQVGNRIRVVGVCSPGLHLRRCAQHVPVEERRVLEGEIVRKCLARSDKQCSFVEHRNHKVCCQRGVLVATVPPRLRLRLHTGCVHYFRDRRCG